MVSMMRALNGPQTIGNGRAFWCGFAVVLVIALGYPALSDPYDVGNVAYLLIFTLTALGLSLMWGYAGMFSFGQTAFFGVAGYSYGVISINLGASGVMTLLCLLGGVAVAALFAWLLGYFLVYGRVSGVFFGIVTFATTLALAAFFGQTAGPEWAIGTARFNGFNGMIGMPALMLPWFDEDITLEGNSLYYFVLVLLLVIYLGLRVLVNSRFGNVLVAIREDPLRTELLGYNVRKYQLVAFVIGSSLAGLSGVLYTGWGQFIPPASMGLPAAAMPVIWVAFSGRQDLTATVVGTFVLLLMFQNITVYSQQYALILMGFLLLVTVMLVPAGFFIGIGRFLVGLSRRHEAREGGDPS
jgi:branched-chain amino acid transport system permease protein